MKGQASRKPLSTYFYTFYSQGNKESYDRNSEIRPSKSSEIKNQSGNTDKMKCPQKSKPVSMYNIQLIFLNISDI